MKPLVSILICAYNAEKTIGYTLQSALAQTWPRKEIIVLDDGSRDQTAGIVRRFKEVKLVCAGHNKGFAASQNHVYQLSQGDYIQYLDADDLLTPDKIEKQLAALREGDSPRILLSSPWAPFYFRTRHAHFVRNPLCQDLSPVEWLLRKMGQDCHMQNATWLVKRELVDTAGPWDARLYYDQDGEFFCRVLLASDGVRFVPGTGIYYRASGMNSISFIGHSDQKKESLLISMKLHMQYLRSLEDSERVRKVCVTYMQKWLFFFYLSRPDIVAELQEMASQFGGRLVEPQLRWKFAWLRKIFGYPVAQRAQIMLPQYKASVIRAWDKAMFDREQRNAAKS